MEELKEFGIELGGAFYRVVTTDIDVYSSLYDTNEELKKRECADVVCSGEYQQ